MTQPIVSLSDVRVTYPATEGPVDALRGIDLALERATATAILGRSGSGKSTLISVLALLRRPTGGRVIFDGFDAAVLPPRRAASLRAQQIGIVFQSYHLDPALTATENIMLSWYFGANSGSRREARARAEELANRLDIGELARRYPNEMSGGQRQRVAIARALFPGPLLFLADEPTGNLDEATANEVAAMIMSLPERFGTTVVVTTHDRAIARLATTRIELARGTLGDDPWAP